MRKDEELVKEMQREMCENGSNSFASLLFLLDFYILPSLLLLFFSLRILLLLMYKPDILQPLRKSLLLPLFLLFLLLIAITLRISAGSAMCKTGAEGAWRGLLIEACSYWFFFVSCLLFSTLSPPPQHSSALLPAPVGSFQGYRESGASQVEDGEDATGNLQETAMEKEEEEEEEKEQEKEKEKEKDQRGVARKDDDKNEDEDTRSQVPCWKGSEAMMKDDEPRDWGEAEDSRRKECSQGGGGGGGEEQQQLVSRVKESFDDFTERRFGMTSEDTADLDSLTGDIPLLGL
ncbi:hypothetical protein GUITHDRAFT_107203 [Guillardia theta CCMP2712]|uniref:Transmembrane protein n=1 Tax=Guillardia theta (strain CCMP2712) TaxID=905079 RepID=L1JEA0_GUITC|nr:hypothetical protein GUITHDRAFT_107203 [Guillardia theta CCMP2712]EKX46848.1 hypothetical protein GUITHDRAFT_107203 [Guillardia theta CCMP2712]|eukprot:XP_005833828.1 hypothetical protein GUITHDRAFT_107203 [Guillardia theta CCMP2712]